MSYWGATVITNFITVIPGCGLMIAEWLWGGYSVGNPTLQRFFALHFMLPFILSVFVFGHIVYLHEEGSSCPLGLETKYSLIPFYPFYAIKDLFGFSVFSLVFSFVVFFHPNMFAEADNFIKANPMVTPPHIVPEWYFLFAYAILRCIPSKGLGVVMLIFSLLVLAVLPWTHLSQYKGLAFLPLSQFLFWWFIACFIGLTWVGAKPAEPPYIRFAVQLMHFYFIYLLLIHPLLQHAEANHLTSLLGYVFRLVCIMSIMYTGWLIYSVFNYEVVSYWLEIITSHMKYFMEGKLIRGYPHPKEGGEE